MILPISPSFVPFFRVTTSEVEMPSRFSFSMACARMLVRCAAQFLMYRRLKRIELQVNFKSPACTRRSAKNSSPRNPDPVRIHHQMLDRPFLRQIQNPEKVRMQRGSPPEICTTSGCPSFLTTASSHPRQRTMLRSLPRRTARITNRAPKIAMVRNLHQRQTRMLFMVGTQSAVIRATPLHRHVINQRHLRRLHKDFAAQSVILHVIRHQHPLRPVHRTSLQQKHAAIFKNDLPFQLRKQTEQIVTATS